MIGEIGAIRLRDLEIFNEVARAKSIREAARRTGRTSGQISKAIQNLEKLVGTKLFQRSASGVLTTGPGAELQVLARDLLGYGEKIEALVSEKDASKSRRILTIAGTSFLTTHFATPMACRLASEGTTFRFLDLPPDQLVAVGLRGGFELAVHSGSLPWPNTWTTESLGRMRWLLCAREGHPLPKQPRLKQILEQRFVVPSYWTHEGVTRGNDQFPLPMSRRRAGFETATADAAVPILLETDQVAFLPDLLARAYLRMNRLREVKSVEIPRVEQELFLSVKADSVPAPIFRGFLEKMRAHLKKA